jgi:hypothetical protein
LCVSTQAFGIGSEVADKFNLARAQLCQRAGLCVVGRLHVRQPTGQ